MSTVIAGALSLDVIPSKKEVEKTKLAWGPMHLIYLKSNPMHLNAFLPFHNFTSSELQFYIVFIPVVLLFLFQFFFYFLHAPSQTPKDIRPQIYSNSSLSHPSGRVLLSGPQLSGGCLVFSFISEMAVS